MCIDFEAGSYVRFIDSCITHLKAQGTSSASNGSNEEEEGVCRSRATSQLFRSPSEPGPGFRYKYSKPLQLFPSDLSTEMHFLCRKLSGFETCLCCVKKCSGREKAKFVEVLRMHGVVPDLTKLVGQACGSPQDNSRIQSRPFRSPAWAIHAPVLFWLPHG